MNVKNFLIGFVSVFSLTFVVSVTVSYLWSYVAHGTGAFDWASAIRYGVTFGIIFPSVFALKRKNMRVGAQ